MLGTVSLELRRVKCVSEGARFSHQGVKLPFEMSVRFNAAVLTHELTKHDANRFARAAQS